jgi:hypothetical protein
MAPKIMDSRQPTFCGQYGALFEQGPQRVLQTRAAVSPPSPRGIPDEGSIRGNGEFPLGSITQTTIDLIGNAAIDWKQARFIELRLSDVQSRFSAVVVTERPAQQFPASHSRGE